MERKLITSIEVGENREVTLEVLLAKLGIVETVLNYVTDYIEKTKTDCVVSVDDLRDASQQLADVYFAIKCGCRGFDAPGIIRTIAESVFTNPDEGGE